MEKKMTVKEKLHEVIPLNKSDFYSFKMWVKDIEFEDGKTARKFTYSIDRSFYKGKKEDGTNDYDNESLNLSRASDISYVRKLLQILRPKENANTHKIGRYYANKIMTPSKKDESKKFLTTYRIYRKYNDKDGNLQETKGAVFPCNDMYVLMDFLGDCVKKINDALNDLEPRYRSEFYGDSDKQAQHSNNDFVDEPIDDDIPF
jgi:hypothetical protein